MFVPEHSWAVNSVAALKRSYLIGSPVFRVATVAANNTYLRNARKRGELSHVFVVFHPKLCLALIFAYMLAELSLISVEIRETRRGIGGEGSFYRFQHSIENKSEGS